MGEKGNHPTWRRRRRENDPPENGVRRGEGEPEGAWWRRVRGTGAPTTSPQAGKGGARNGVSEVGKGKRTEMALESHETGGVAQCDG